MKKFLTYLQWLPFAISLGALVIYLVYTIQIKLNPAIIVTNKLIGTLKAYLIIALVALFIGLLIILIKKIYKLMMADTIENNKTVIKEEKIVTTKQVVVDTPEYTVNEETKLANEIKKDEEIKVVTPVVTEEKIVKEVVYTDKKEEYKLNGIICPECGKLVSKDAAICTNCGILFDDEIIRILDKYESRKTKKEYKTKPMVVIANICLTILFIILIFLVCNLLYNRYNQNIKNITSTITRRQ